MSIESKHIYQANGADVLHIDVYAWGGEVVGRPVVKLAISSGTGVDHGVRMDAKTARELSAALAACADALDGVPA